MLSAATPRRPFGWLAAPTAYPGAPRMRDLGGRAVGSLGLLDEAWPPGPPPSRRRPPPPPAAAGHGAIAVGLLDQFDLAQRTPDLPAFRSTPASTSRAGRIEPG